MITKWKMLWFFYEILLTTILDKTVEKIVYLYSIFLNIVVVPVRPSPPSPESNVVVYSKESLIPGRLWEATVNWGTGFSFRKGDVLETVLLRRKVDMMGKTFSSSFVRDCSQHFCIWSTHKSYQPTQINRVGNTLSLMKRSDPHELFALTPFRTER